MFFEMILSAMAQYSPYIDDDEDVILSERITFLSRTDLEEEEEEEEEQRPSSSSIGISGDKPDEAKTAGNGDNGGDENALETTASSTNTQAVPRKIARPPQPRPKRAILDLQTYLPDAKNRHSIVSHVILFFLNVTLMND
jgi:hypothetical protein